MPKEINIIYGEWYSPNQRFIGDSILMQRSYELMKNFARIDLPAIIVGETGTGKELLAQGLHYHGPRRNKNFVAIGCAEIPESLFENELFGHATGAYTGAVNSYGGKLEFANSGTLFLDEVGEMPLEIQAKLLRVLQNQQVTMLGSAKAKQLDFRVISATNKNLLEEVVAGRFRWELLNRLHVAFIALPPLRERGGYDGGDIGMLAQHYGNIFAHKYYPGRQVLFSDKSIKFFNDYDWPGNIRELEGVIIRTLSTFDYLALGPMVLEDYTLEHNLISTAYSSINFNPHKPGSNINQPLDNVLRQKEKEYLIDILTTTKGNVSRAAAIAGKYRPDFYKLLKRHGINPQTFKEG